MVIVGSTQLKLVLMVRLITLRPAWLLKSTLRFMVLIILIPSHLWPRLLLFTCFSPWLMCTWPLYQLNIKNDFLHSDLDS